MATQEKIAALAVAVESFYGRDGEHALKRMSFWEVQRRAEEAWSDVVGGETCERFLLMPDGRVYYFYFGPDFHIGWNLPGKVAVLADRRKADRRQSTDDV